MSTRHQNEPGNPTKGSAYTIYTALANGNSTDGLIITPNLSGVTYSSTVSKDGGAFVTTTNSVSNFGNGILSLTLTATEMNADVVVVYINTVNVSTITDPVIVIRPKVADSGGSAPTVEEIWSYEGRSSNCDLDLEDISDFIKRYASGFTEKQLLALIVKLLKS